MPESPDFEQIAREILDASDDAPGVTRIAEQLRLVWNARGAADISKVETEGHGQTLKNLTSALRSLDR